MKFIHSDTKREATPLAHIARTENINAGIRPQGTLFVSTHQRASIWPGLAKLLSLVLLFAVGACANVCTPLNVGANGPFPAVVNGIDAIDWGVARIQWTSDATSGTPSSAQKILYSSAAEWAANPGVYAHTIYPFQLFSVTSSSTIQSGVLSNLAGGTLYHVTGQSYQGGAWCSSTDTTFTTLTRPVTAPLPQQPAVPNLTPPVGGGNHWIYGSNCGTTAGSAASIVTANWQDCFYKATVNTSTNVADDLSAPPGVYQVYPFAIPNSPFAVAISCSTSTSFCTQSGSAPANGTQVVLSAAPSNPAPAPINQGVPYYVVNATGGAFQLSQTNGGSPLTLLTAGSSVYYIPYNNWLNQAKIKVFSTASPSLLPPAGVRLGLSSLAQYLPNMVVFQSEDPIAAVSGVMQFAPFADNYWFQNIAWSTDPAVAASTNPLDPIGFRLLFQTTLSNHGITLNQCALIPALPPSRSEFMVFDGTDMAIINSLQYGLDWWQPFTNATAGVSFTSTSITIPPVTYNWVVSGGSNVGQKAGCTYSGGGVTAIGGSATGTFAVYAIPDAINPTICDVTAVFPTGTTGTANNLTFTTAANPATPTYTYASPSLGPNYTVSGHTAIPIVNSFYSVIAIGQVIAFSNSGEAQASNSAQNVYQSGGGIEFDGWHRAYFDNDEYYGAGIVGPFVTDALTSGTPCYGSGAPCAAQDIVSDITITRSSLGSFPCLLYSSSCWNGGDYFWRNTGEFKAGWKSRQDGNIFGPWSSEVGEGECALHEAFSFGNPQFVGYVNAGDWTFTNNTCANMSAAGLTTSFAFVGNATTAPYPYKNILIRNNLFYNDNGYNQGPQPWGSGKTNPNEGSCPYGHLNQWSYNGQDYIYDHNTVYGEGGCLSMLEWISAQLGSGMQFTNNIYNFVGTSDRYTGVFSGTIWAPYTLNNTSLGPNPVCQFGQGLSLFSCLTSFTWSGNVMLATWNNSNPASLSEYTSSQISSLISQFPSSSWPSANTLAARISSMGWFNPSSGNFRLKSASPYISGVHASSDGLDIGVNMDQLAQHQGSVSNVRALNKTSTSAAIYFYAPDSFACSVDWGSGPFYNGSGAWTRVLGSAGSPDPRVQSVTLSGLPAHGLIYYRLNCATMQPTGTVQLP